MCRRCNGQDRSNKRSPGLVAGDEPTTPTSGQTPDAMRGIICCTDCQHRFWDVRAVLVLTKFQLEKSDRTGRASCRLTLPFPACPVPSQNGSPLTSADGTTYQSYGHRTKWPWTLFSSSSASAWLGMSSLAKNARFELRVVPRRLLVCVDGAFIFTASE